MTIHKSKGLEAAVVFVYGGFGGGRSDGLLEYHEGEERVLYLGDDDHAKNEAKAEREREEQRLFYVASSPALQQRAVLAAGPGRILEQPVGRRLRSR